MNKFILGTVQFGLNYGINNATGKPSQNEVFRILDMASEKKIDSLDTADAYGNANDLLGQYHQQKKQRFKILSKFKAVSQGKLFELAKNSIEKLLIQNFEVYSYHSFADYINYSYLKNELLLLKNEGLTKKIGISIYTNSQFQQVIMDDDIDVIQLPFNLLDNFSIRGELLIKAKEKGKIIHTRSAFLQGLFFKSPLDNNIIVQNLKHQLLKIQEIAKEKEISIECLALGYCLQQQNIDKVIIGVDSIEQLEANFEALKYKMDQQTINTINRIYTENTNLLNPALWN